jgi:hypothetical protein
MVEYLTYRRWRLRDGVDVADVHALVRDRIVPHYHRLDPAVRLELEMIDRTRSVLAIQRWPDRARRAAVEASDGYAAWLDAYRPILRLWDGLVEFEAEWESSRLF